jgi:hypothetical protein
MHPNVERLETFSAYAARDVPGIRDCLADDALWHSPRHVVEPVLFGNFAG